MSSREAKGLAAHHAELVLCHGALQGAQGDDFLLLPVSLVERLVRELLHLPSDYAVSKLNHWK